jgi:hypothetical protein
MRKLRQQRVAADLEPLLPNKILDHWANRLTREAQVTGMLDSTLVAEARLQLDPEQLLALTTHVEMISVTDLADISFTNNDVSHLLMQWVGVGAACIESGSGPPVYTAVVLLAGAIPPSPDTVQ